MADTSSRVLGMGVGASQGLKRGVSTPEHAAIDEGLKAHELGKSEIERKPRTPKIPKRSRPQRPTAVPREQGEVFLRRMAYPLSEGNYHACVQLLRDFFLDVHQYDGDIRYDSLETWCLSDHGEPTISPTVLGWLSSRGFCTMAESMALIPEKLRSECSCFGARDARGLIRAQERYRAELRRIAKEDRRD